MIALTAATILTPLERIQRPILIIENGHISEISSHAERELPNNCPVLNYEDAILVPAFVDIHVHGAAGHDVMESSSEALPSIERFLAKHGVGNYLATTVTAPIDLTLAALERIAGAIENSGKPTEQEDAVRARPIGIHLEGPFISHARRGVHPPKDLLRPSVEVFNRFWEAARGHIRILTIAPELEGALDLIKAATAKGVCVSLGHSNADLQTSRAAVEAGARHATHLFNGMRPMTHRDPGIVGEALTNALSSVEIIADGIHLDPTIVKLILDAKGRENVILITDGTAATGMPDGRYHLGAFEFDVKDGVCLADGKLAGSTLTMDRAVRNVMQFAGYGLQDAVALATLNPGRSVRSGHVGTLRVGAKADIVVLTPNGEVLNTMVGGIISNHKGH